MPKVLDYISESLIKMLFKKLKKLGVPKQVIKQTVENVNTTLEIFSGIRGEEVRDLIATIDKTLSNIDVNAVNGTLNAAQQTIQRINAGNIVENINRISEQINNVGLIGDADLFLMAMPFIAGLRACIAAVNMAFNIATYFEIKKFREIFETEIKSFREEMRNYSQQHLEIAREVRDVLEEIYVSTSYQSRERIEVINKNKDNISRFYEQGLYIESIKESNAFLDSTDDNVFFYRGLSLYRLGYYLAAAENFSYAYKMRNVDCERLYWRGLSLLRLGFMEAAKRDFDTLVAIRPNWLPVIVSAHIHLASTRYETAIAQYTQIREENNQAFLDKHDIHFFIGLAYIKSGRYRDAIATFSIARTNDSLDIAQRVELLVYDRECYKSLREEGNANNILNLIMGLFRNNDNAHQYFEKIRRYEESTLLEEERQYLEWILTSNTAITGISIVDAQDRRKFFSDFLVLFTLKRAAWRNPEIEYILSELYIKNGELITGFECCDRAKMRGNISAENTIKKCFELLDPEISNDSISGTNIIVQENIAIKCAIMALFRSLFGLKNIFDTEKNIGLAIQYLKLIPFSDEFAQLMLGYCYQYGHLHVAPGNNNITNNDYAVARAYYAYYTIGTMNPAVLTAIPDGSTLSEYYLSIMYYHAKGIDKNVQLACTLYKRAFPHQRAIPRPEFAKEFYYGINISPDYRFAFEIFDACLRIYPKKSLEYKEARYYKGRMYYLGQNDNAIDRMNEGKELLVANAENGDINSALMLNTIFTRQEDHTRVQQYTALLPNDFTRIVQYTSIACNRHFVIYVYDDGNDLTYSIGQFTSSNHILWNGVVSRFITNGRHPSVAMNNQNRICLVLEGLDQQLYYRIGLLQQNTIVWGNLLPLNNFHKSQFPKIAIYNNIVILVYSTLWFTNGRIGKLLENNSIEWGEEFPCIHDTDAPSLAIFQRHYQIKVMVMSSCRKGKLFYNIGDLLYNQENLQNSRINWHYLVAEKLNVQGYYPSICSNGDDKVWLTYCETKDIKMSSFLNCVKGTLTLVRDIRGVMVDSIAWETQPKTYDLGNFPAITCKADGKIMELHSDLGGLISSLASVFNPMEQLVNNEIPHNPIIPIYLVTFFLYLDLDERTNVFWTNLTFYVVGINGNWNINENWKMREQTNAYNITIPVESRAEGYTIRYKFSRNNMPLQRGRWLPGGNAETDHANFVFRIPENAPKNHLVVSYFSGDNENVELRHSDNWEQGELLNRTGRAPSVYMKHTPFSFNEFRFFKPQRNEWHPDGNPLVANFRREHILRPSI